MTRFTIIVLLAAIIGGVAYQHYRDAKPRAPAATAPAPSVSVQPVVVAPMVESVASYGNLVSERTVNIVSETPGTVQQILFKDGQTVAAGDPLVVMDARVVQAQLQSARAQAETDALNLQRIQILSRQHLNSMSSLEQAQARASGSQADVAINERKLGQLTLRAPFAGVLGSASVDAGAFVTTADTIVRLDDTHQLSIEFRVPSAVALRVTQGMPVHVEMPGSGSPETVEGQLTFIDPTTSTDTRSVLLRAVVPNGARHLRPGLYVRVSLDLRTHPDALVVPVEAVLTDLNGSYLFTVDDKNVVHQRAVTLGLTGGDMVELLDGAKAGDQIVTIGQFRLRDGDTVRVVAAPSPGKGAT